MDLGIKNKTALVLASSKGLGYGVALALSREGSNVVICSRDAEKLQSAGQYIHAQTNNPVSGFPCNVSELPELDALFTHCESTFGLPDILVYNNGGPPSGNPASFGTEAFTAAFHNGFHSAVHSIRKALPHMQKAGWGRILCITSISVKQPLDDLILSNTTRTALTSYIKTISRQVAKDGVTINSILPGLHDTNRLQSLAKSMAKQNNISVEQGLQKMAEDIPMGRLGTTEEFGAAAAFLCSAQASYITGQAIVHDGGLVRSTF